MIGSAPDIAVHEATDQASFAGIRDVGHRTPHTPLANAASSTCLATGPARRPPVEALISSVVPLIMTAIAYCGLSAGANAVIHACERSGSPSLFSWAVPVLAAAWMPPSNAM